MMRVEDSYRTTSSDPAMSEHVMNEQAMSHATTTPLVSIAMPTYNRPEYLRRALESVVVQSYANLEILVGDNGNSNLTREIIESFNDPRITYIGREQNLGMALNVLSLLKQGRGTYFCVLADDDFWGEHFIAKLVRALEQNPNAGMAFSDYFVVDGHNEIQSTATEKSSHECGRDQLTAGLHAPGFDVGLINRNVPLVASVFRRQSVNLERFLLETANTYDLWLFYLALENGGGAYFEKERLMYCRVHPGQDSMNTHMALDLNAALCYDRFLEDSRLKDWHRLFRQQIVLRRTRAGTQMLHLGRSREARIQLLKALQKGFQPRAVIGLLVSLFPATTASVFSGGLRGVLGALRRVGISKTSPE
jgi:glycosyltransferase involved in cell wall biosynthesis